MRSMALLAALACCVSAVPAGAQSLGQFGQFGQHGDIGSPSHEGSVDLEGDTYVVTGGGANIWGSEDHFQYVWT